MSLAEPLSDSPTRVRAEATEMPTAARFLREPSDAPAGATRAFLARHPLGRFPNGVTS